MTLNRRAVMAVAAGLLGLGGAGCTERDQREAGREIGRAADEVHQETREAGRELREGAENVREGIKEHEEDTRR